MRDSMKELQELLQAKFECIWINTFEEAQAVEDIKEIAGGMHNLSGLYAWSHTSGVRRLPLTSEEKPEQPDKKTQDPSKLFEMIEGYQESEQSNRNIWILFDAHHLSEMATFKRRVRDLKEHKSKNYNPIIVISPSVSIPMEQEKLFRVIDYDLPGKEMIREMIDTQLLAVQQKIKKQKDEGKTPTHTLPSDEEKEKIVRACQGLTHNEIRDVLRESLVKFKGLSLEAIANQKIQLVRKSGVLDCIEPEWSIEDMGGNAAFKEWLYENASIMCDSARNFSPMMFQPKGYAAIGISGCSKTLSAEAVASMLGVPLLKLSMSKIMNKLVGESEKKISQALRVAEANAPCVLLLDEVEKMLGGKHFAVSMPSHNRGARLLAG